MKVNGKKKNRTAIRSRRRVQIHTIFGYAEHMIRCMPVTQLTRPKSVSNRVKK
jgi:hypothetical protein